MNSVEPIRDIKTIKNIRFILKNQSVRNELLFIFGITEEQKKEVYLQSNLG